MVCGAKGLLTLQEGRFSSTLNLPMRLNWLSAYGQGVGKMIQWQDIRKIRDDPRHMKLISINVASPADYEYRGQTVRTAIYKQPVQGPVELGVTNLAGDRQANREVHGGEHKAVYAYSHDHYAWWHETLDQGVFSPGQFGENLTISGLDEANIHIGDRFRIGNTVMAVTGPRIPCQKLAMKFKDPLMPRRFTESGRSGFYLRVIETGTLQAGDDVLQLAKGSGSLSVRTMFDAYSNPRTNPSRKILRQALELPDLDPAFGPNIEKRLRAPETLGR